MTSYLSKTFLALLQTTAIVLLLIIVRYYFQNKKFFESARKLPGPKSWPIVGSALYFLGDPSGFLNTLNRLTEHYDLAAIWEGPKLLLFINRSDYAETFFTDRNLIDRSEHVKLLRLPLGKGLITANGCEWRRSRKIIAPTFQVTFLRSFIGVFQRHSEQLVKEMQEQVGKSSFDLYSYLRTGNFYLIIETLFGLEYGVEEETFKELLPIVERVQELASSRMFQIWHHSDFIYRFSRDGKEFFAKIEFLRSITKEQILKRRQFVLQREYEKLESQQRSSFLLHLLEECDDEELTDHLATLVTSGFETSSNTLGFFFVMMALHPQIQEKVYREVQEVYGALENGNLGLEDLNKLQYLEMAIKETLRLFPTLPLTTRKTKHDFLLGEYVVPKDVTVAVNIFKIHRDGTHFKQPDKFDPDHFLPEQVSKRHQYAFIPFGAGPRVCVGYKYAMWSLKVVASSVLLNYKLECDYKLRDIRVEMKITLKMINGYQVRLMRR